MKCVSFADRVAVSIIQMMMNMLMTIVLALVMASASSTASTPAIPATKPQLDDSDTDHCFTTMTNVDETRHTRHTSTVSPTESSSVNTPDTKLRRGYIRILEEDGTIRPWKDDETLREVACTLCNRNPRLSRSVSSSELNRTASAQVDQDQDQDQDQDKISLFRIIGILLIRIIQHQPPQRLRG